MPLIASLTLAIWLKFIWSPQIASFVVCCFPHSLFVAAAVVVCSCWGCCRGCFCCATHFVRLQIDIFQLKRTAESSRVESLFSYIFFEIFFGQARTSMSALQLQQLMLLRCCCCCAVAAALSSSPLSEFLAFLSVCQMAQLEIVVCIH